MIWLAFLYLTHGIGAAAAAESTASPQLDRALRVTCVVGSVHLLATVVNRELEVPVLRQYHNEKCIIMNVLQA